MAKKSSAARTASPAPVAATTTAIPPATTPAAASSAPVAATPKPKSTPSQNQSWTRVLNSLTKHYLSTTPQRTLLLDAFQVFLVVVGILQFLYCILAGNYPFNAFLSGFSATVGQFVLTASLRIQTTEGNKKDFVSVSPERAFADYVGCSLILHFFCVNFIN